MQKIRLTSTSSVVFLHTNKIVKRLWKKRLATIGRKSRMSFAYCALDKKILVFYSYLIPTLAAADSSIFRICKEDPSDRI